MQSNTLSVSTYDTDIFFEKYGIFFEKKREIRLFQEFYPALWRW